MHIRTVLEATVPAPVLHAAVYNRERVVWNSDSAGILALARLVALQLGHLFIFHL